VQFLGHPDLRHSVLAHIHTLCDTLGFPHPRLNITMEIKVLGGSLVERPQQLTLAKWCGIATNQLQGRKLNLVSKRDRKGGEELSRSTARQN